MRKTKKRAVKKKAVKKKKVAKKAGCEDCGYPAKYLHDDCPMCEPCPSCNKTLMECECKESE